jgi:hypothetical protein
VAPPGELGALWTCPLGLHPIAEPDLAVPAPAFLPPAPARNSSPPLPAGPSEGQGGTEGSSINGELFGLDSDLQGAPSLAPHMEPGTMRVQREAGFVRAFSSCLVARLLACAH